jgi:hypothetical protein
MPIQISFELEELHDSRRELEDERDHFFDGDSNPNYGDRGYQDLLERISEISQQISDIEADLDDNLDLVDKSILEMEEAQDSLGGQYFDNDLDFNMGDDEYIGTNDVTMDDCN